MTTLTAGDSFPEGVVFSWVPYTPEKDSITSCGIPQNYNASKEFADKKVVLFAVPVRHLPGFIDHLKDLKAKGVDLVVTVAFNDAWVMSAWGKANGIKGDDIVSIVGVVINSIIDENLFMSDADTKFSKSIGWTMGDRTARYALVIDHGKVTYAEKETSGGEVTVGNHSSTNSRNTVVKQVLGLWRRRCVSKAMKEEKV
ncbi:hypothetical protein MMC20_000375 [Loxospora ochrophaea]|nr:hypothetical protein [Loxospora ochrophaea]